MAGTIRIAVLATAAQARAELASVGAAGQQMGDRFNGIGTKIGGALKVGAVAGIGALGLLAKSGLDTASQMEQASIAFTTMLGSGEKAQAFIADLTKFAANTPFEFAGLQEAASSLISAGIEANKVIPIMTTLGDVTSGMGTGAEGIQRATVALQQMNAAQKIGAEDLNQLRDAGIPVYDLLSAATGKSKAEVVKLAQAGKLGKKELDALMKGLETGAGLERFTGLMEKQAQSLGGVMSTLKDNFSQGLAAALAPAIPQIKKIVSDIGNALPGIFSGVISALGKVTPLLATGWNAAKAAISGVVAVLSNPVFQAVAAAVIAMVTAWKIYQQIMIAVRAVTAAYAAAQLLLNAVMAANPIGIIVLAIIGLVAALAVAYARSETFRNIVQAVWAAIKAAVGAVIDWFTTNIPKIWEKAQEVWNAVSSAASTAWNLIKTVVSAVISAITAYIQAYIAVATAVWNAVKAAAQAVWDGIKAVVNAVIVAITAYINAYKTVASAVWTAIKAAAEAVWNGIKTVVNTVISAITGYINTYKAVASAIWSAISSAASTAWNAIKSTISGVISTISQSVNSLKSTISSAFSNAASLLYEAGRQVIQGLINGIKAMASAAVNAAKGVVNDAIQGAKNLLGIGSPSRVFRRFGRQSGEGLVLGFKDMYRSAQEAAEGLVQIPRVAASTVLGSRTGSIDVTAPLASTLAASSTSPTLVQFRPSGDRLTDAILQMIRYEVRSGGGSVQNVLGRA